MSAFHSKADILGRDINVRLVPIADIKPIHSMDLVGGSMPNVPMPACAKRNILESGRGRNRPSYVEDFECFERYSAASDKFSRPVVLRLTISM